MTLLAGTLYDPGTLVTKATSATIAMTAFDTTNLRLSFTVPDNGAVLVRLRCNHVGATTMPFILLGVLEGSTVRARVCPQGTYLGTAAAATRVGREALFVVPGLTPAANLTWDAAYGVEVAVASTNIKYGGPNDTTTDNANGGFSFEIYDCANLLGAILYDPASSVTKSMTTLIAMTAFDTTNLRITFTAPSSGKVLVRIRAQMSTSATFGQALIGVLDGATIRGRVCPAGSTTTTISSPQDASFVVTGLTPSNSYTWDAAYSVDVTSSLVGFQYGGPDNTTSNDAYGAFQYEIWAI